ncbi:uncharacterized protein LOC120069750 isoform X3 [Benincasa hispida]|uniref:uncharacterized protein LOC120069750 isoform X3 n=1 Tax=Benincasa hispida TaxID=102211 RepID=UPI001900F445|nr:uncharacterized protein LOC120069750 isoform X3 [Benincasa hispida]
MLPCACSYGMRISSDFCTASWAALNYRTTNFHGQIKNNDASRQISCQALNYQELLFLSLEALMKTQNDDVRLKYFKQAEETVQKLDLDSNTNACLLAENFRSKNLKTRVICCPKTIDGDLKCKEVPTCFGFDYACKLDGLSIVFLLTSYWSVLCKLIRILLLSEKRLRLRSLP